MNVELPNSEINQRLQKQRSYLNAEFGLKRNALFGSIAKGTQAEESDVDIVVEFARPIRLKFVAFTEFIEDLLGRITDDLTSEGIKGIRNSHTTRNIQGSMVYV